MKTDMRETLDIACVYSQPLLPCADPGIENWTVYFRLARWMKIGTPT